MGQMSMFDGSKPLSVEGKKIRLIELFAGIGAQAAALRNIGANFEHYRVCEFDKYAVKSYNSVHGTNFKTSDIRDLHAEDLGIVETDKYTYIMTYSFPCTDLSLAGKREGMQKGSGTRSGLLWEVERLLTECKNRGGHLPQILLMENVPQVHGTGNKEDFDDWCNFLLSLGYNNKWQDLNAKDYGIPQNRDRTFMVSWQGDFYYDFPEPKKLNKRLRDLLETKVDEKYYLSSNTILRISNWKAQQDPLANIEYEKLVSPTLTARGAGEEHSGMVLVTDKEISHTVLGDNSQPKIIGTKKVEQEMNENVLCEPIALDEQNACLRTDGTVGTLTTDGSSPKHNNRVVEPFVRGSLQEHASERSDGICPTLTEAMGMGGGQVPVHNYGYRIRKLTPRECWRLMAFSDEDFDKAREVNSDAQLYKQAGNSICVNVLEEIFKKII